MLGGSQVRSTSDLLKEKARGLVDIPEASLNDRIRKFPVSNDENAGKIQILKVKSKV